MNIPTGSIVYVSRFGRNHFGVYIGNGSVIHFQNKDYDSYNYFTPVIHEVSLAEFLGENSLEVYKLIKNQVNKTFYFFKAEDLKKDSVLKEFLNPFNRINPLFPIKFVNTLIQSFKNITFDSNTVVKRAKSCVGCNFFNFITNKYEKKPFGYDLKNNNCEHFASWCITGEHKSKQTKDIFETIKSIFGNDPFGDISTTISYRQVTAYGKSKLHMNHTIWDLEDKVKGEKNFGHKEEPSKSFFICQKPGENSEATSKYGLKPDEQASINGINYLNRIIKFNDGGCVYSIRILKNATYIISPYRIEVEAEGPHGIGTGSGYLRFYDKSGDSYSLSITDSSKKKHHLDYTSKEPEIIKIAWSNSYISKD